MTKPATYEEYLLNTNVIEIPTLKVEIDGLGPTPVKIIDQHIDDFVLHLDNSASSAVTDNPQIFKTRNSYICFGVGEYENEVIQRKADFTVFSKLDLPTSFNGSPALVTALQDNITDIYFIDHLTQDGTTPHYNALIYKITEADNFSTAEIQTITVNTNTYGNGFTINSNFEKIAKVFGAYYATAVVHGDGDLTTVMKTGLFKSTDLINFDLMYVNEDYYSFPVLYQPMFGDRYIYVGMVRYDTLTGTFFDINTATPAIKDNLVNFYKWQSLNDVYRRASCCIFDKPSGSFYGIYKENNPNVHYKVQRMTEDASTLTQVAYSEYDVDGKWIEPMDYFSFIADELTGQLYLTFKRGTTPYDANLNYAQLIRQAVILIGEPGVIYKENVNDYLVSLSVSYNTDYLSVQGTATFEVDARGSDVWSPFNNPKQVFKRGNLINVSVVYPTEPVIEKPLLKGKILNVDGGDINTNTITVYFECGAMKLHTKNYANFNLGTDSLGNTIKELIKKAGYKDADIIFPAVTPTVKKALYVNEKYIEEHINSVMNHFKDWGLRINFDGKFELVKIDPTVSKYDFDVSQLRIVTQTGSNEFYNLVTVTSTNKTNEGKKAIAMDAASISEYGESEDSLDSEMWDTQSELQAYADTALANHKLAVHFETLVSPTILTNINSFDVIKLTEPYRLKQTTAQKFVVQGVDITYENNNWNTTISQKSLVI